MFMRYSLEQQLDQTSGASFVPKIIQTLIFSTCFFFTSIECSAQSNTQGGVTRDERIEFQTTKALSDLSITDPKSISKRRGLIQRRGRADIFSGKSGK